MSAWAEKPLSCLIRTLLVPLTVAGWLFLFLYTLYMPFLVVRQARRLGASGKHPEKISLFANILVMQLINLGIGLAVAWTDRMWLFPPLKVSWLDVALGIGFMAVFLGTVPLRWKWRTDDERRKMAWRLPQSGREMGWWVAVSVGAGLTEEITYRGVLFQLWSRLVTIPLAAALCALVFALVHFHSGVRSMAIIFVMALVFHAIVWCTGSLYTAIAVHAIYDLAAGMIFMRLMRTVPDPLEAV